MASQRLDVVGIGNALVDVLSHESDDFVVEHELVRGRDDAHRHRAGRDALRGDGPGDARSRADRPRTRWWASRRSAAPAAFVGRVSDDQLGAVFGHDLRAAGVEFATPRRAGRRRAHRALPHHRHARRRAHDEHVPRRVGASSGPTTSTTSSIARAQVLYLEGYLWDEPAAKDAFRHAAARRARGRATGSRSRSPTRFCVERHRDEFLDLVEHDVDVLFANEDEITLALRGRRLRRRAAARPATTARSPRSRGARRAR